MADDVFVVETSFAQQSMWLLHQMDPGKPTYNVTAGARIRGPLRPEALRRALNDVVARHESLRTVFQLDGGRPMQVVADTLELPVPVDDVHPADVDEAVRREAETPIDLEHGPVLRMRLLRLGPEEHVLLLVVHHIVFDGWSSAVLFRELSALYQYHVGGPRPELPELPVQYADFAVWQRDTLTGAEMDRLVEFWTDRLSGVDPLLLPADRPRPAVRSSRGATVESELPAELVAALEALARDNRATLFTVLLAGMQALLSRYSGQRDITFSTAVAGRGRSELADLIGYFVNTLVLRTDLSGGPTVTELIGRSRQTWREAFEHQDMPFDKIVETVQPARDGGVGNSLVRTMLVLQNMEHEPWEAGGLVFEPIRLDTRTALLDLSITIEPTPSGVYSCSTEYSTDLFDRVTVERLTRAYRRMLEAFVADPSARVEDLALDGDSEWDELLAAWNATDTEYPEGLTHDLIAGQAARTPAASAVEHGDDRLTHAELEAGAERVARALRRLPAGPDPEPIAVIIMTPRVELAVAVLGVLRSGWAFVPLDAASPPGRVADLVRACGARAVLTEEALAGPLAAAFEGVPVLRLDAADGLNGFDEPHTAAASAQGSPPAPRPESLACVFYTSGSTGTPKGVMISHGALANFCRLAVDELALTADDRFFQLASAGFDVFLEELLPVLVAGGTCVLPAERILAAGGDLAAEVAKRRVTVLDLTPAYFHEWVRELAGRGGAPDPLRLVVVGGDRLLAEHVDTWRRFGVELVEGYGLTEATVISTANHLLGDGPRRGGDAGAAGADRAGGDGDGGRAGHGSRGGHRPGPAAAVGDPVANTRLYVLDDRLRPVLPGGIGEIYIAGAGLARGYLGRRAETAGRFVPDPFGPAGSRMCRTGDRGRRRADGPIEFVGRADHQVKVRGHRVEPGEIEAALVAHPTVGRAVVTTHTDGTGPAGPRLIAYVAPVPGARVAPEAVRSFAAERLPEALVPAAVVVLDELPLTPHGKVDRAALTALVPAAAPASREPATPYEEVLCRLLAEVVGGSRIGAEDDFFAVGGDSISAIRLAARARAAGVEISPRDVFVRRTAARLALVAEAADAAAAEDPTSASGPLPATPALRRLLAAGGSVAAEAEGAVLRVPAGLRPEHLAAAWQAVLDHHDGLRLAVRRGEDGRVAAEIPPRGAVSAAGRIARVDVSGLSDEALDAVAADHYAAARAELAPHDGDDTRLVWLDAGDRDGRLLVVLHRAVTDADTWRLILVDLAVAHAAAAAGEQPRLDRTTTPFRQWALGLAEAAREPARAGEIRHWREVARTPDPLWGARPLDPERDTVSTAGTLTAELGPGLAGPLLSGVTLAFRVGAEDVLLTALALAAGRWCAARGRPRPALPVQLTGNGREERAVPGSRLARTAGWFAADYPVAVPTGTGRWDAAEAASVLLAVKERLRAVPGDTLGHGLLRYLNPETAAALAGWPEPQLGFTYLGRDSGPGTATGTATGTGVASAGGWAFDAAATGRLGSGADPGRPLARVLQLEASAEDRRDGPVLTATWTWAAGVLDRAEVAELAGYWHEALVLLASAAGAQEPDTRADGPDLSMVSLTPADLDALEEDLFGPDDEVGADGLSGLDGLAGEPA